MTILLDIDGVMVQAKSWSPAPQHEDGFSMFSSKAVDALNLIINKTNASILLTTSHKNSFSIPEWYGIFNRRGIQVGKIDRLPQNQSRVSRYQEIMNWYSKGDHVQDFVIIDDDKSLNGLPDHLKSRLIATKPLIGLTNEHVSKSVSILNTPLELV